MLEIQKNTNINTETNRNTIEKKYKRRQTWIQRQIEKKCKRKEWRRAEQACPAITITLAAFWPSVLTIYIDHDDETWHFWQKPTHSKSNCSSSFSCLILQWCHYWWCACWHGVSETEAYCSLPSLSRPKMTKIQHNMSPIHLLRDEQKTWYIQ